MSDILEAVVGRAKQLISKGYAPLPLNGKAPTILEWQQMDIGLRDLHHWVEADLIHNLGLRTGDNGLVVLDFDGMDGYEVFAAAFPDLSNSYTVRTGSGKGMHVYLTVKGDLPRSTGQLKVPGGYLEIKAKGRQVVIPPSIHPDTLEPYRVKNATPITVIDDFAPIQAWIDTFNPKPEYMPIAESAPTNPGDKNAYARQTLANMAAELAALAQGSRNDTCNRMAWKLAHFVRHGDLTETEVRSALEGAMFANGSIVSEAERNQFEKTFRSGFQDGFSDTSFEPGVYQKQDNWKEQKRPNREMPGGWTAYNPPTKAVSANGVVTIQRTRIIKRSALLDDLSERIQNDDYMPDAPPIIFPLTCLHSLGGQARVTKPGKIIIFAGSSGSGKTSALETMADLYVQSPIPVPVWIYSPEWTPDELAERAVQRNGGVSQDDLYLHEIDQWRTKELGFQSNPDHRLTQAARDASSAAIRTMRSWKEDVYFVENSLMSVDEMAEVIAAAKNIVDPFPRVLICDYAQLLKANDVEDRDDSGMYGMVQRFKAVCVRYGLVGILATQTTKAEARQNIKEGEFLGTTVINCTKNSRGKKGKVRVASDPDRLRILDQPYPNQIFSADDFYLGSQSGRWLNDDAANLWLTLNPEYAEIKTNG